MKKIMLLVASISTWGLFSSFDFANDMDWVWGRWMTFTSAPSGTIGAFYTSQHVVPINIDPSITDLNPDFFTICLNAALQWQQAGSYVYPVVSSNNQANLVNYADGANTYYLDNGTYISPNDVTTLATTAYTNKVMDKGPCTAPNGFVPRLLEADVFLCQNSTTNTWKDLSNPNTTVAATDLDLGHTVLHEMGHVLGLGHITHTLLANVCMKTYQEKSEAVETLFQDDLDALRDLYDPGADGKGLVPCSKFTTKEGTVNLQCKTVDGFWGDVNDGIKGCQTKKYNCEPQCTKEDGHYSFKCICTPKDGQRGTFSNNFGLSEAAVNNLNIYAAKSKEYNFDRSLRGVLIICDNDSKFKDVAYAYDDYLSNNRKLSAENQKYSALFKSADVIIDELMPLVDATFRCTDNLYNPNIRLTGDQLTLINNFINNATALDFSQRCKNELIFIKNQLPGLVGKNLIEAYEHLLIVRDPNL